MAFASARLLLLAGCAGCAHALLPACFPARGLSRHTPLHSIRLCDAPPTRKGAPATPTLEDPTPPEPQWPPAPPPSFATQLLDGAKKFAADALDSAQTAARDAAANAAESVKQTAADAAESAKQKAADVAAEVAAVPGKVREASVAWANAQVDAARGRAQAAADDLAAVPSRVQAAAAAKVDEVKAAAAAKADELKAEAQAAPAKLQKAAADQVEKTVEDLSAIPAGISSAIQSKVDAASSSTRQSLQSLQDKVNSAREQRDMLRK